MLNCLFILYMPKSFSYVGNQRYVVGRVLRGQNIRLPVSPAAYIGLYVGFYDRVVRGAHLSSFLFASAGLHTTSCPLAKKTFRRPSRPPCEPVRATTVQCVSRREPCCPPSCQQLFSVGLTRRHVRVWVPPSGASIIMTIVSLPADPGKWRVASVVSTAM